MDKNSNKGSNSGSKKKKKAAAPKGKHKGQADEDHHDHQDSEEDSQPCFLDGDPLSGTSSQETISKTSATTGVSANTTTELSTKSTSLLNSRVSPAPTATTSKKHDDIASVFDDEYDDLDEEGGDRRRSSTVENDRQKKKKMLLIFFLCVLLTIGIISLLFYFFTHGKDNENENVGEEGPAVVRIPQRGSHHLGGLDNKNHYDERDPPIPKEMARTVILDNLDATLEFYRNLSMSDPVEEAKIWKKLTGMRKLNVSVSRNKGKDDKPTSSDMRVKRETDLDDIEDDEDDEEKKRDKKSRMHGHHSRLKQKQHQIDEKRHHHLHGFPT
ncbi:unnamed protein product [Orchesella dallaii]|uniref:Uncharacterized protein n=1 Tax=Orchesella dallaii TaxID=48710 RepID=A0ABP1RZH6_9HEXA